jgi:hypothetical protein
MGHLLTTASTTIDSTDAQDVCLDSLRALVAASASIPCVASVNFPPTRGHSHMRRLISDSGIFSGMLNCTFDMAAPLNLSNVGQNFVMDCQEINGPSDHTWAWIVLGIMFGPTVLALLYLLIPRAIKKIKSWRDERAKRALERTDKAKGLFSRVDNQARGESDVGPSC